MGNGMRLQHVLRALQVHGKHVQTQTLTVLKVCHCTLAIHRVGN